MPIPYYTDSEGRTHYIEETTSTPMGDESLPAVEPVLFDDTSVSCESIGYVKAKISRNGFVSVGDIIKSHNIYNSGGYGCEKWAADLDNNDSVGEEDVIGIVNILLNYQVIGCSNPNSPNYYCDIIDDGGYCRHLYSTDYEPPKMYGWKVGYVSKIPDWLQSTEYSCRWGSVETRSSERNVGNTLFGIDFHGMGYLMGCPWNQDPSLNISNNSWGCFADGPGTAIGLCCTESNDELSCNDTPGSCYYGCSDEDMDGVWTCDDWNSLYGLLTEGGGDCQSNADCPNEYLYSPSDCESSKWYMYYKDDLWWSIATTADEDMCNYDYPNDSTSSEWYMHSSINYSVDSRNYFYIEICDSQGANCKIVGSNASGDPAGSNLWTNSPTYCNNLGEIDVGLEDPIYTSPIYGDYCSDGMGNSEYYNLSCGIIYDTSGSYCDGLNPIFNFCKIPAGDDGLIAAADNAGLDVNLFTVYKNRLDCETDGFEWISDNPYDIPVVAIFGPDSNGSLTNLCPNGCAPYGPDCTYTDCSNIRGISPRFKSTVPNFIWNPPLKFQETLEWYDLEDDSTTVYPYLMPTNADIETQKIGYQVVTNNGLTSTEEESLLIKVYDPKTKSYHTAGCFMSISTDEGNTWTTYNGVVSDTDSDIATLTVNIGADNDVTGSGCTIQEWVDGAFGHITTNYSACNFTDCNGDPIGTEGEGYDSCCEYDPCGLGPILINTASPHIWDWTIDEDGDFRKCGNANTFTLCVNDERVLNPNAENTLWYDDYQPLSSGICVNADTSHVEVNNDYITWTQPCLFGDGTLGNNFCNDISAGATCEEIEEDELCECATDYIDYCGQCQVDPEGDCWIDTDGDGQGDTQIECDNLGGYDSDDCNGNYCWPNSDWADNLDCRYRNPCFGQSAEDIETYCNGDYEYDACGMCVFHGQDYDCGSYYAYKCYIDEDGDGIAANDGSYNCYCDYSIFYGVWGTESASPENCPDCEIYGIDLVECRDYQQTDLTFYSGISTGVEYFCPDGETTNVAPRCNIFGCSVWNGENCLSIDFIGEYGLEDVSIMPNFYCLSIIGSSGTIPYNLCELATCDECQQLYLASEEGTFDNACETDICYQNLYDDCGNCIDNLFVEEVDCEKNQCGSEIGECSTGLTDNFYHVDDCGICLEVKCKLWDSTHNHWNTSPDEFFQYNPCTEQCGDNYFGGAFFAPNNPDWNSTCADCAGNPCCDADICQEPTGTCIYQEDYLGVFGGDPDSNCCKPEFMDECLICYNYTLHIDDFEPYYERYSLWWIDPDGDGLSLGTPTSNNWNGNDYKWCGCMDNPSNPSFIDPHTSPNDCPNQPPPQLTEGHYNQCQVCLDYSDNTAMDCNYDPLITGYGITCIEECAIDADGNVDTNNCFENCLTEYKDDCNYCCNPNYCEDHSSSMEESSMSPSTGPCAGTGNYCDIDYSCPTSGESCIYPSYFPQWFIDDYCAGDVNTGICLDYPTIPDQMGFFRGHCWIADAATQIGEEDNPNFWTNGSLNALCYNWEEIGEDRICGCARQSCGNIGNYLGCSYAITGTDEKQYMHYMDLDDNGINGTPIGYYCIDDGSCPFNCPPVESGIIPDDIDENKVCGDPSYDTYFCCIYPELCGVAVVDCSSGTMDEFVYNQYHGLELEFCDDDNTCDFSSSGYDGITPCLNLNISTIDPTTYQPATAFYTDLETYPIGIKIDWEMPEDDVFNSDHPIYQLADSYGSDPTKIDILIVNAEGSIYYLSDGTENYNVGTFVYGTEIAGVIQAIDQNTQYGGSLNGENWAIVALYPEGCLNTGCLLTASTEITIYNTIYGCTNDWSDSCCPNDCSEGKECKKYCNGPSIITYAEGQTPLTHQDGACIAPEEHYYDVDGDNLPCAGGFEGVYRACRTVECQYLDVNGDCVTVNDEYTINYGYQGCWTGNIDESNNLRPAPHGYGGHTCRDGGFTIQNPWVPNTLLPAQGGEG